MLLFTNARTLVKFSTGLRILYSAVRSTGLAVAELLNCLLCFAWFYALQTQDTAHSESITRNTLSIHTCAAEIGIIMQITIVKPITSVVRAAFNL